ncbi:hypothetical protein [Rickettsia hoogstraalii]|uniref:hypothetical protein n=1 Tax=Rickettsia hoogstraalii TaxID=467174 RepID=UPI00059166BD|nr:hypothetical protein [Rickettsia hoogstraalii]
MNLDLVNNDILNVPIGSLAKFETKQLYEYLTEANKRLDEAKKFKDWLHSAIALKYDPFVKAKRKRMEKDTGIIHIDESNFKITNDVPKKVEWRQDILGRLLADLIAKGGNMSDYVEITYHIPEAKYNSLSEKEKYKINAARIIRLGNPVYKITKQNNSEFETITLDQFMLELEGSHE